MKTLDFSPELRFHHVQAVARRRDDKRILLAFDLEDFHGAHDVPLSRSVDGIPVRGFHALESMDHRKPRSGDLALRVEQRFRGGRQNVLVT